MFLPVFFLNYLSDSYMYKFHIWSPPFRRKGPHLVNRKKVRELSMDKPVPTQVEQTLHRRGCISSFYSILYRLTHSEARLRVWGSCGQRLEVTGRTYGWLYGTVSVGEVCGSLHARGAQSKNLRYLFWCTNCIVCRHAHLAHTSGEQLEFQYR